MNFIISCCFVASLFLIPLFLYRKIYFKDVSCVMIVPVKMNEAEYLADVGVDHVRPGRRAFKNLMSSERFSFVSLGSGFYALYGNQIENVLVEYDKQITFSGAVCIFKRNRFGRFVSVDLSSRLLANILKKFN